MDDSEASHSPLEEAPTRHRKGHRSSKERLNTGGSTRELARWLVTQEHEVLDLRQRLEDMKELLNAEVQRADSAESRLRDAALRLKSVSDAKAAAQQEAARANEELRLYKIQYENAQQEIHRAQKIIDSVEAQRIEAEEAAARARTIARKLKEERVIQLAREEGRRQGLQEGLAQGRSLGFEEGRAEGYARGRAAAARGRRRYQDDLSTVDEEDAMDVPPSRDSASPPKEYQRRPSKYSRSAGTATPGPSTMPTPAPAPLPQSPPKNQEMYPIPVHNMTISPLHMPVTFPPDGVIPLKDSDERIRLPPPHEMAPPPPTPSPPPSITLQNAAEAAPPEVEPIRTIPPPAGGVDYGDSAMSDSDASLHQRPRHRRRRSNDSQSTSMSSIDILRGPPEATSVRSTTRNRVLSSIQEERERTSSMSSPAPVGGSPFMPSTGSTFYQPLVGQSSIPDIRRQPSTSEMYRPPSSAEMHRTPSHAELHPFDERLRHENKYTRPSHSPGSSPELAYPPASLLRPPSQPQGSRRSSTSAEYDIEVEPPSAPESEQSRSVPMTPNLLSAEDVPPETEVPQQVPDISPGGSVPIVLEDGQLPPGFQPIGPPVPSPMSMSGQPLPPSMTPQSMYSMGPAGMPLPPSTYVGTPSVVGSAMPGEFPAPPVPTTEPVIPHLMRTPAPGQPSATKYSRTAIQDSSSDSDDAVSSRLGGSVESLTTPPARRKSLPKMSTPSYPVAPIPPGTVYPEPPATPMSTMSRGTAAARVPLPGSVAGSVMMSPTSTMAGRVPLPPSIAGSVMMSPTSTMAGRVPLPPSVAGSVMMSPTSMMAGRVPLPLSTPGSTFMSPRSASRVPLPPSTPGSTAGYPYAQEPYSRSNLGLDNDQASIYDDVTRANTAANAGLVRPPSAARMSNIGSPAVSQVSLAPTATSARSMKKGKKKKAKSRIASVEEADED